MTARRVALIGGVATAATAAVVGAIVGAIAMAPTAAPAVALRDHASPSPAASASASASNSASASASASNSASGLASASAIPRPTSTTAVAWPAPVRTETLNTTRKISGSVDLGNVRFVAGSGLGDGGQSESQSAMFELADGATLANVIIGTPAADGVHCKGSCTLRNVWWQDVGEDAATFKGTSAAQTMVIDGGGAMHASDKLFQHNGPGTMIIRNFRATDIGKLYRSCGNCSKQFARHVEVTDVTVTAPLKTLVGINPNLGDTARIRRVTVIGAGSNPVICARFKGVTSGEPTLVGNGPDGTSCVAEQVTTR
jgi:pectate lyase